MKLRRVLLLAALIAGVLCAVPAFADEAPTGDAAAAVDEIADEAPDYDPWKPFNERTFWFNYSVADRYVMKPLGRAWDRVLPGEVQRAIARFFDNVMMPTRFINDVLQVRPRAAGEQLARFAINSTVGVAGFLDVAAHVGIRASDADAGQTLGVWGFGPGPYIVVPLLPPLSVRDGIGYGIDTATDPTRYVVSVPFLASLSATIVRRVNDRALHLADYDTAEEISLDLYSAVRNFYLQARRVAVERGRADSLVFRPRPSPTPPR